jgi:hypothetical protein
VPGDNFSRRVARAAAAGGGRTYRAQTPVTWYLVLFVICLLGVSLVAYSRYEVLHPLPKVVAAKTPPTATTEWLAAVAVDACGKFAPSDLPVEPVPDEPITSLGNGVVQIDPGLSPQAAEFEGTKATLGAYLGLESAEITPNILSFPGPRVPVPTTTTTSSTTTTTTLAKSKKSKGATTTSTTAATTTTTTTTPTTTTKPAKSTGKTTSTSSTSTTSTSSTTTTTTVATEPGPARNYKNGQTSCDGKPGQISVETWPSPTSSKGQIVSASKASGIRFANGELITIAFVPKGTAILQPPAAARNAISTFLVQDPTGIATTTLPSTTIAPSTSSTSSTTSTTVAGKGSTTTTTTTAAGKGSTTSTTSAAPTSSTS